MSELENIQISFDVSPKFYETLEDLAKKIGGDKAAVLRKAVALIQVAIEAKDSGKVLCIADKDNNIETQIIGITKE